MYQFIVFKNVILNIITDYYQLFCCLKNISSTRLEPVCLVCAQSHPTLRFHWNAARQAPLSAGFSRQEYWSGTLSNPGIEHESPASPALAGGFFTPEPPGMPLAAVGLWSFVLCIKQFPSTKLWKRKKWWNFYLLLEKFLNSFGELKQSCWRTTNEGRLVVELRLHYT